MVNVTDFAGAVTSGNIHRAFHNITLNTESVMHDDSRHEPKISNFTGGETGGDKSARQVKRGGGEQMLPHEIKLADMHMKRRAPHLYMSKKVRDGGRAGGLNEFNSILKQSLMSPKKSRQIATLREMEDLERASISRRERNNNLASAAT